MTIKITAIVALYTAMWGTSLALSIQHYNKRRIGLAASIGAIGVPVVLAIGTIILAVVQPSASEPGVGDAFFGMVAVVLCLGALVPFALIVNGLMFLLKTA